MLRMTLFATLVMAKVARVTVAGVVLEIRAQTAAL